MKASLSILSFLGCVVLLLAVVLFDYAQLPPRIVSHFNGAGLPDGWATKSLFLTTMLALGLGLPAFVVATMFSIRFFPPAALNVPHSAYWRMPQNYRKACAHLFHSAFWFGSLFVLWQAAFAHIIFVANISSPQRLNTTAIAVGTLLWGILTMAWIGALILYFSRIDPVKKSEGESV